MPNPKRIISVVPSQTELLFDLGLDVEVVGITKFCIHPNHWFRNKQRVGGTKNLNLNIIRKMKPDLILANKEENTKEQIEELQKEFTVYVSDISNIDEALKMIEDIGILVNKKEKSIEIINAIRKEMTNNFSSKKKAVYFIWNKPYMVVGQDTFINDMMQKAGFENQILQNRYPEISEQELMNINPEIILLSSEPFPFKQKHIDDLKKIMPTAIIKIVDGELFSWYGSRMLQSFKYFSKLNEELSA